MTVSSATGGQSIQSVFVSKRSTSLDCIRATAIIMVVVFHVATRYPIEVLDRVAFSFRLYGTLGVDIFFPLSGYLITSYLLRNRDKGSIKTFFLRRLFRIVPLYLVAVSIYFLAVKIIGADVEAIDRIWIPYLFLTGWFILFYGVDAVPYTITWSLSVEEFSYLLLGIAAFFSRRQLFLVLVLASVLSIALRFHLNTIGQAGIYYFPPARLDSIAIGGIVAVLLRHKKPALGPVAIGIMMSVALRLLGGAYAPTFLYTLVTFLTCLAIIISERWLVDIRSGLITAYARIGFYSYFIYLFHFMILEAQLIIQRFFGYDSVPFWVNAAICLGFSYILASMSFRWFEGPMLLLGRKLETRSHDKATDDPAKRGQPQL